MFAGRIDRLADALRAAGAAFDSANRPFVLEGVPIHLATLDRIGKPPARLEEIDQVRTVGLADLINMKLRSADKNILRSIDLADVVGLVRAHRLDERFAPDIDKAFRATFRKIVRAIEAEQTSDPERTQEDAKP